MFTKDEIRAFKYMINKTRTCKTYIGVDNKDEVIKKCEYAFISDSVDHNGGLTFHTHPYDSILPSDIDKMTTEKLGKAWLCIGRVESNEVVCYHKDDNYSNIRFRLKL